MLKFYIESWKRDTFKIHSQSKSTSVQNLQASKIYPIKIHPVEFRNRLPTEGKGSAKVKNKFKKYKIILNFLTNRECKKKIIGFWTWLSFDRVDFERGWVLIVNHWYNITHTVLKPDYKKWIKNGHWNS